ncbi:CBS domain-containing protein [Metabacillus idriensis]|uniref:CBS domain-containing protein n=1 Tax=Metabacillus idriensis TaxID=324768 RepID=A0A6I2M7N5_9BACI|nr:CBS domain-containing protein [Metabacillus idriensis]MCM3595546.1 CBS domain-containing protein [Metabacillus idriensis]MRX52431.1 CBS domain-containing protein [Metabacillus idriensis]OHR65036.1 CBS domain-containing protein [Bacillus sp. HMSC76G11]
MTKDLVTISSSQSIQEAAELMSSQNIGSIPVVDGGQVKGVITDRDITLRSTAHGMSNDTKVADVMSSNLVTGTPDMSSEEAAQLMSSNQIRRLPIVENNQLVGYVALGDLATDQMSNEAAGQALTNISEQH